MKTNLAPKTKHGCALLFAVAVVLLCVPSAYIVAALVGGVVLIAGLPAAAKYFGVESAKKDEHDATH